MSSWLEKSHYQCIREKLMTKRGQTPPRSHISLATIELIMKHISITKLYFMLLMRLFISQTFTLIHLSAMEHIILFFMDFSSLFPRVLTAGTIGTFKSISLELISQANSYKCDEQSVPETNKQFICSLAVFFNVHYVDFCTVLFSGEQIH